MSKIIDAQDILADARDYVQCLFLAMNDYDEAGPIQAVANAASVKINEAIVLLDEYRTDIGERPVEYPAPPAAEPKTALMKRGGK